MRKLLLFMGIMSLQWNHAQKAPTGTMDPGDTTTSLLQHLPLRNIGPSVMSGRVVDIAVNPDDATEFYVGYASGGLWYTDNNGTTFRPVMDATPTQNVGAVAVHWPSNTLWVGTGENNASRSSYAGIGVLKSMDGGATWEHMGLKDAHHIGRIRINPNNPNEVVVGVTGHLYTENADRGLYKTQDGGKNWTKTLTLQDDTGIIDVAHAPDNFNIQYAAAWQKDRKAWDFKGSGPESAIYKSSDAGDTWTKISTRGSGFPTGAGVGRIGLAVFDTETLYAVLDNQDRRPEPPASQQEESGLRATAFNDMDRDAFLALSDADLDDFLKTNNFQEKYRAQNVKQLVRSGAIAPADMARYLGANTGEAPRTPVIGAQVYKSADGGKTWKKTHEEYIDDLFYSYGYYFAQIAVDPSDLNTLYLSGVPLIKSTDGGKTFTSINGKNVHSDHHALWVNPKSPKHLINGNDGGVNISYDAGANWIKCNMPQVGQFYAINVDNESPYNVYGGLQDNGVWVGPHDGEENSAWHQSGHYPWKRIMGGDGMQVAIDDRNADIVFTGFQFGNYYRLNLATGGRTYIQPKHQLGEEPYRFNWQTPILLSPHNQDILYLGSNHLHRSMDQGDSWQRISPDLTHGSKKGNVAYGTLTTISESALQFGLLYTGSDDGRAHVSIDGGSEWKEISNSLPKGLWVSRILASSHDKDRVYLALNGYRSDDFTPYLYVSEDQGGHWTSIGTTLPTAPVNVVLEDPTNPNVLYVGTDNGLHISLDRGQHWQATRNGMPPVAVHDLALQKRDKHLLVGTHGRSIFQMDVSPVQQMEEQVLAKKLHIFPLQTITFSKRWGNSRGAWGKPTTPGLEVYFYSQTAGDYNVKVKTDDAITVSETRFAANKGLNVLSYDVAFSKTGKKAYLKKHKTMLDEAQDGKTYLPSGTFHISLEGNGAQQGASFIIEK